MHDGDFHWFDAEAAEFELIDEAVAGFHAIRGNVETDIAAPAANAGCGCAYLCGRDLRQRREWARCGS